jgi:hypothetical protein
MRLRLEFEIPQLKCATIAGPRHSFSPFKKSCISPLINASLLSSAEIS